MQLGKFLTFSQSQSDFDNRSSGLNTAFVTQRNRIHNKQMFINMSFINMSFVADQISSNG